MCGGEPFLSARGSNKETLEWAKTDRLRRTTARPPSELKALASAFRHSMYPLYVHMHAHSILYARHSMSPREQAETRHRNNDDSGDNDPAVTTGESSSASDLVQESSTMRWEGHRTQGANIALGLRYDDTVRALERRSDDREAKEVLLRLAKELKQLNDAMAGRLLRMSAVNRTVVEVLQKSEDGKAALMMRKAAELLVKVRPW